MKSAIFFSFIFNYFYKSIGNKADNFIPTTFGIFYPVPF
jgi:hypothetical protein